MVQQLFLLQFIAHLISDFILQPQSWCDKKEEKIFSKYFLYHSAIVFATSYILSFDFGFWICALILTILHFIIDCLKNYLIQKSKINQLFFFDQFLHIIIIAGVVILYDNNSGIQFLFDLTTKTITIIAGFLICTKPANIAIKYLFRLFSIETPVNKNMEVIQSLPNAGKLIGISERLLAITFIILGQYEAVGLIIAAKSILRFNDTQKSEYVLVGTLLSFGIAVFTGIGIKLINGI